MFSGPSAASKLQNGADRVAVGRAHTCDVKVGASALKCSGANNASQVGEAAFLTPGGFEVNGVNVAIAVGVVDRLVAGGDHACVLSSGALLCWGQNTNGQLGDGSLADSAVPVSPRPF